MSPVLILTVISGILTVVALIIGMRPMDPKTVKVMRVFLISASFTWTLAIGALLEKTWLNW